MDIAIELLSEKKKELLKKAVSDIKSQNGEKGIRKKIYEVLKTSGFLCPCQISYSTGIGTSKVQKVLDDFVNKDWVEVKEEDYKNPELRRVYRLIVQKIPSL